VTESAAPQRADSGVRRIELSVDGMSCGACARRVENELNKLDGIHASVKFATNTATVDSEHDVDAASLCRAIETAGYHAEVRTSRLVAVSELGSQHGHGLRQHLAALITAVIRWITVGHMGG